MILFIHTCHGSFGWFMFNIYRTLFLALKKIWVVKITSRQILTTRWKTLSPHQNFPSSHWQDRFPSTPLMLFGKPWHILPFHHKGRNNFTYFSVRLQTVTLFNTPKNEMSLNELLVKVNGFLISTWKYWIWISKNENVLSTKAWKGCWLLFYPKFCVGVSLNFS